MKECDIRDHPQSLGEEIANCVSHGIGLVMALIGAPILIMAFVQRGDRAGIIGASVFAVSVILLYFASTLYHALPINRAKLFFRGLDHGCIYLLIAGTYTPFTLGVLRGTLGWILFVLVWGLAVAGIVLKTCSGYRYEKLSLGLYLLMGWLALIAIKPLWLNIPPSGIFLIVAGGCAYTVGVIFYSAKSWRYSHFIWHLFVLTGTVCHFFAVLWYSV